MKILAIGAHPADAIDLAGGTLFLHKKAGHEVIVVSVTTGIHTHGTDILDNEDKEKYAIVLKQKEFSNACDCLGIHGLSWRFSDESLIQDWNLLHSLMVLIRIEKPDIVITHHPNEYAHWDHSVVGEAVCRALKAAIKSPGEDKYWVPTVYFFGVQFRPENARIGVVPQPPDILIDIEGELARKKVEALYAFKSQGYNDVSMLWNRMRSFESEMGRADGLKYSEGFILYYPLKRTLLPVNTIGGFYNKEVKNGN